MKIRQVIEHNNRNIFHQKSFRKWGRETSSRPLFVFQESLILGKSKLSAAWFQYTTIVFSLVYNENKLQKTLGYWSRDMLNFDFLENGLGIVSPPYFAYHFSSKMLFILYLINWPIFIAWLILLLEILVNMCIVTSRILKLSLSF